jgi:hypothetical protein
VLVGCVEVQLGLRLGGGRGRRGHGGLLRSVGVARRKRRRPGSWIPLRRIVDDDTAEVRPG